MSEKVKKLTSQRFGHLIHLFTLSLLHFRISAGGASVPGIQKGRKREGASTVSLNHPLAVNFPEAGEP
jgi:hypothetical protein